MTTKAESFTQGGVKFVLAYKTAVSPKAITDRSGNVYYFAGDNKLLANTTQVSMTDRVGASSINVTIVKGGDADLTVDDLAAVAGTYTVKVQAIGQAKISLTNTESPASDANTNKQYDAGEEATGALGVAIAADAQNPIEISVMTITISGTGAVSYDSGAGSQSWAFANLGTAVESKAFYYGIEVDDTTKNDDFGASGTLTATVFGASGEVTPA